MKEPGRRVDICPSDRSLSNAFHLCSAVSGKVVRLGAIGGNQSVPKVTAQGHATLELWCEAAEGQVRAVPEERGALYGYIRKNLCD